MSKEAIDLAVAKAEKNLWDYINGLDPEMREKAIAYQQKLEDEAKVTEGGMMTVIQKQMVHQVMSLSDAWSEIQEIATGHVAGEAIRGIMKQSKKE